VSIRTKYLGQRSFSSNVIDHTHIHTNDCSTCTTKVVDNKLHALQQANFARLTLVNHSLDTRMTTPLIALLDVA